MLKSYEAIYDHGQIKWLGEAPRFKRVRVVLVADDDQELDDTDFPVSIQTHGNRFAELLLSVPPNESSKTPLNDNQAEQLLAETAGAWGKRSADEIEAILAEQRRQNWGDE